MATHAWWEVLEMRVGQTLPIIQPLITEEDMVTVLGLIHYSARATFAYVNAAPHVVREVIVTDTTNGLIEIRLDGTETPSVGNLIISVELVGQGTLSKASNEEWGQIGLRPIHAKVLAA